MRRPYAEVEIDKHGSTTTVQVLVNRKIVWHEEEGSFRQNDAERAGRDLAKLLQTAYDSGFRNGTKQAQKAAGEPGTRTRRAKGEA